jgi:hypothetical protein
MVLIFTFIIFFSGIIFQDVKFAYHLKQILLKHRLVIKNLSNTIFFDDIPFLKIDMSFKTREYLKSNLNRAIEYNDINKTENRYKPITISYKNKNYRAEVRLKGLTNSHRLGNKKSLKVKLKKNSAGLTQTILGFSSFNLMDPKRRWNEKEWFFREVASAEGLLKRRYDFVEVKINSNKSGVYSIEENFSKEFFEFNKIKLAPIISIDSDKIQGLSAFNQKGNHTILNDFNFTPIQSKNLIYKNSNYNNQYNYSKNLLISFLSKKASAEDILNLDKFAKFLALSDIFGAWHGTDLFNFKLYYDPYTKLLEPIPDDMYDEPRDKPTRDFAIFKIRDTSGYSVFYDNLFNNMDFLELYYSYLKKYSEKKYIDKIFKDHGKGLDTVQKKITKNDLYYFSNIKTDLYNNSKLIREFINPNYPLEVFKVSQNELNELLIDIQNNYYFPIKIKKITINTKSYDAVHLLNPKKISLNSIFENAKFEILEKPKTKKIKIKSNFKIHKIKNLKIHYSIAGLNKLKTVDIPDINLSLENKIVSDITEFYDQLFIDEKNKKIKIKNDKLVLNKDLVIPDGYLFEINSGTEIIFEKNSNLIVKSNIVSINQNDKRINFIGKGKNCILFYKNDFINLGNINFENFSKCEFNGLYLTGGINFYETDLRITNFYASKNRSGDDLINIINSKFKISNLFLEDTLYDGIDIDYSDGIISNMKCINCGIERGGDGLDLSHTKIFIDNLYISNSYDKGLSIGENSNVNIKNLEINNSKVCVANKDGSMTTILNGIIENCEIGLSAYNKKNYYDFSKIKITNVNFINNQRDFVRDDKNKIIYNGYELTSKEIIDNNILKVIYE